MVNNFKLLQTSDYKNSPTLKDIFTDIIEQKLTFMYKGSANKIFSLIGKLMNNWMLDMEQHKIHGQFLLAKDDVIPMATSWEVRFSKLSNEYDNTSILIYNEKLYKIKLLDSKQIIIREGSSSQLKKEKALFLLNWKEDEDNLAEFTHLKTNQALLSPNDYYNSEWKTNSEILANIIQKDLPGYVLNLDQIKKNYQRFTELLPMYKVYYSIKTNPDLKVLKLLYSLGSSFEVVSYAEIILAFKVGISPEQIIFSAPVKRAYDISEAYKAGIRIFVADCHTEVDKLAKFAPESQLLLRLKSPDSGAKVKLSSKYGMKDKEIIEMFLHAKKEGLVPYGISLHVGGQNEISQSWISMQNNVHQLFAQAKKQGLSLQLVNIGGGFPINLHSEVPDLAEIATTLKGSQHPKLSYCAEPGRIITGDSAKLICPVITVSEREDGTWLYLDASIFGSLFMMGIHAFEYPIRSNHTHLDVKAYNIASLSCDGRDIIGRDILLPKDIQIGHLISFHLVGAYSLPIFNVAYAGVSEVEIYYQNEA